MTDNNNNKVCAFLSHSNKDYEKVLYSESGIFYLDEHGIVQRFVPSSDNSFIDEETEFNDNYTYTTYKSIRTFIVSNGVKGFVSDFMRGVKVIERFELSEGLISIGEDCFANCILPKVIIPDTIQCIGDFAFGHTHIDTLQLPTTLHSPYGRQFKDSYIGTLRLPKEWKDDVSIEDGRLGVYHVLNSKDYGYLRWPSTYVKRIEFY